MNLILTNFGNVLNSAFPKGLVGEILFADLAGGKPRATDDHDFVDLNSHLLAHEQHNLTSQLSDPVNLMINKMESDISFVLGLFMVTRIQDPQLRQRGINLTLQSLSKNGFAFFSFD